MTHDEIKAARKRLGLTMVTFAKLLGVTFSTVWAWEHNRHGMHPLREEKLITILAEQEREQG